MLVEALVLRCDRALEHIFGNLVLRYLDAVFEVDFRKDGLTVICVYGGDARVCVGTDAAVIGQAYEPSRADHATEDDYQAKGAGNASEDGEEIN